MAESSSSNSSGGDEQYSDYDDASSIDELTAANGERGGIIMAVQLVKNNPLKLFERQCKGRLKGEARPIVVVEYLRRLFSLPFCFAYYNKKFVPCSCLNELQENISYDVIADRLSKYLFFFNFLIFSVCQRLLFYS